MTRLLAFAPFHQQSIYPYPENAIIRQFFGSRPQSK